MLRHRVIEDINSAVLHLQLLCAHLVNVFVLLATLSIFGEVVFN